MAGILIRSAGQAWHKPATTGYTSEAQLQDLLADHPTLIPGVGEDVQVRREFRAGTGSADVVAVDLENGLTLVECKLASNPQVRREIIGQVLDYASLYWRMSVEEFDARWRANSQRSLFEDLDRGELLQARLEESLSSGEFRIILAVDEINDDLRRIVEYLNNITLTSVAVIAVVYSRSEDNGIEILIPVTYGSELARAKVEKAEISKPQWTEEAFLSEVDQFDPQASESTRAFLKELERNGCEIVGGSARKYCSLNIGVNVTGDRHRWPIALYTYTDRTSVEIRFEDFKRYPDLAERYLKAVESVPGINVKGQEIRQANYAKRPNLLLRNISVEAATALAHAISQTLTDPQFA